MSAYFNYTTYWPSGWWERRSFVRAWWQLYRGDRRLTPPVFTALSNFVHGVHKPFAAQVSAQPIHMEALPQRSTSNAPRIDGPVVPGAYFEDPVAAAIIQVDPRRTDGAAYLSLMRCVNDEETLDRLLGKAIEHAGELGCMRLIGPTGPVPTWQSGALQSHFHHDSPWQTPYNPPYLPDLLAASMQPWRESALYVLATPVQLPEAPSTATLAPLDPLRLRGDLLPLLAQSLTNDAGDETYPPPEAAEAETLLDWLSTFPLIGWVAEVEGETVGFVLLQADYGPLVRRTGGGRVWPQRAYLHLRRGVHTQAGRLLCGAVSEAWQGQGIGQQLWRQTLVTAQQAGWETLTCGPLTPGGSGAAFLLRQGAKPQQRYMIYMWEG